MNVNANGGDRVIKYGNGEYITYVIISFSGEEIHRKIFQTQINSFYSLNSNESRHVPHLF